MTASFVRRFGELRVELLSLGLGYSLSIGPSCWIWPQSRGYEIDRVEALWFVSILSQSHTYLQRQGSPPRNEKASRMRGDGLGESVEADHKSLVFYREIFC